MQKTLIEKAKALRRLHQRASTRAEAEAAARALAKLIHKHRINEAALQDQHEDSEHTLLSWDKRCPAWRRRLADLLTSHYGLAVVLITKPERTEYRIVGHQTDVQAVRLTYDWLIVEIERLTSRTRDRDEVTRSTKRGRGARFNPNSYQIGFVDGIGHQLRKGKHQAEQELSPDTSTQLVLRSRADQALELARYRYPSGVEKKSKPRALTVDVRSYLSGREQGQQTHLGPRLK